jgi:selenium-binding protein 1
MNRRRFLAAHAAALLPGSLLRRQQPGPRVGFASPAEAMKAPRETRLFTVCLPSGPSADSRPDYLAVIDADPASPTYSSVTRRVPMPSPGDELHHFGWNLCSSCHSDLAAEAVRRYLILPGLKSSNIHILDAADPNAPRLLKTIPGAEIKKSLNLSAPHTVHCLPDGHILISMLGDAHGNAPGGFLLLDPAFQIAGRWERDSAGMTYNYDFWYQPRHNVLVSSEWAAPNTFWTGFNPNDVAAGKYGSRLHFWDWSDRRIAQSIDLGDKGLIPLEVRFAHDPDKPHGFVGAALSSVIWHFYKHGDAWKAEPVHTVEPLTPPSGGDPIPGLITDIVLSMDDRFLYLSNWLHGDIRQLDVSDPSNPRLAGQLWVGGLLGKAPKDDKFPLRGGPQMLQLSLDGKRLYVTNSLLSRWDDQFYPDLATQGSHLIQIDCNTESGGLTLNKAFFVDFGAEPSGPARAHEIRYPGGDCTSDIFT